MTDGRGIAATVCRGAHRDTGAIRSIGALVWSLGTCPNGPLELRRRGTTALTAASLGSHVTVTLEDFVFADDDGVVVVAQLNLEVYLAKRNLQPDFTFREHLTSFGGAIEI